MFKLKSQLGTKRGFTLIELLVVIAIIGVLASVVLASLNSARRKSRDARRVADIKQIQLALELYFDSKGEYPDATSKLAPDYIPTVPTDPVAQAVYLFNSYISTTIDASNDCTEASETCLYYHLGAGLEESTNPALNGDRDVVGDVVKGADATGCAAEAGRYCYDVTP
jgi:prepilin-type N-terminal cleavage/methylation domain-containing protein